MKWILKKIKVSDLKENPKNPRKLTEKGLKDLENSIVKFGVAEPLVCNTDLMICGGHGRKKILERLNILEVDCYLPEKKLNQKQFDELGIRLNKNIAGEFDFDILANEFEIEELIEWGFEEKELDLDKLKDGEEVVLDNAIQLLPKREYVIIMCNENNDEWEDIRTKLKLGNVKRGGYKNGSIMQSIGIQRVVKAGEFLELWK